jgi:integrase
MSRSSKGPRLYLRKARVDARTQRRIPDRYFIRDKSIEVSTGCGPERLDEAERQLALYIQSKYARPAPNSDHAKVYIADVLALYAIDRGPQLKVDPATMAGFTKALLTWWGACTLADIRRSACVAYAKHRSSQPIRHGQTGRTVSVQTARRELELLSAAIGFWDGEYHLDYRPTVVLPPKAESNRDALTEAEVARLLKAAKGFRWEDGRWRRLQKSSVANRAHLERFIIVALYTGSRSDVIKRLRWQESLSDPWVDLEDGMIYRRGRDEVVASNKRRPQAKLSPVLLAHMKQWQKLDAKIGVGSVVHHGGTQVGSVRTGFAGCVRDAGLPEGVTAHWLRHTAATSLMEKNVPMWEAAGYLGMTVQTLEKHYAKHRPDHQSAAMKAMG